MLRVPPEGLDAHRFEALLEQGRRELASGEAERASLTLRDALALWRGPALADLAFEPFAQSEIARLEELRLTALEARIEADLALGRQDSLVAELETLVSAHPYREGLRAQLMLALYRSGRQAEALETYRRARRTFSEELGIEPGPRLQELEGAILRHDSSLEAPGGGAEEPRRRVDRDGPADSGDCRGAGLSRSPPRSCSCSRPLWSRPLATRRVARPSPVVLAGDSVAVIDPGTDTIVAEVPVGGRPAGLAVGEGSVWVGNRDDNTLLEIDPTSRQVVRTIGSASRRPTSRWVREASGSSATGRLLRVDPAIDDVVATVRLPRGSGPPGWSQLEVGANAVFACSCDARGPGGDVIRIDSAATSFVTVRSSPVWKIAYGEGTLWALTGYEADTIERIDPESNAAVATISLERIGEWHGYRPRIAVGEGAIWVAFRRSLWRISPATNRFVGSVPVGIEAEGSPAVGQTEGSVAAGYGALWIIGFGDGVLRRVDPVSQTVAKTIPLGTLIYPADSDAIAFGEGAVWVAVTSFAS